MFPMFILKIAFSFRTNRRALFAFFLCTLPAMAIATPAKAAEPVLSFGIVPQQSATRPAREWIPLLNHLGTQAGVKLKFATAKDIPTFEACLAEGAYDIAYMNPYHYTVFHKAPGYVAFARQAGKQLKGLIVARRESMLASLRDLNNRTVAFPSPAAFGASVLPRAEMASEGIAVQPRYVKSHDSVYRAVASGLAPAGGGVLRTFNSIDQRIRNQLKVIYRTREYTPHAFAAHPRVSTEQVEALKKGMLAVSASAPALLEPLGMKGLQAAEDKDWDDVRALNLSRLQTQISNGAVNPCRSG
jgi:phosphonate transport system substrate-binding protein